MTAHLTHEQLCDLLLSNHATDAWIVSSNELDAARDHIRECSACADELATLDQSLMLFRSTAETWSNHEWSQQSLLQSSTLRPKSSGWSLLHRPLVWAAPAALAIAVAVPFTLHLLDVSPNDHANVMQPATQQKAVSAQSDEALLEEINQTLSYSVPAPMQPLADPTASQTSDTQRKN
jgi:hypothetical protein